ncbi:NADH dehydrogenase [ubiquinone] 1 alpha subcomplex subunit 6-like [Eucalyptus grandis]|uniref:NADH dehydrogenase [ubiquinone] 1 alpha subcomplex subunit 6-like n=1 Tax=Eucalyptus grandis TaxID=71139 RepID=UPI00192EB7ED|nr:NADH dehydrogenase [ubiquinone] 1 alpha subcomplex subunit 6-like [Eucalyptus grandis]
MAFTLRSVKVPPNSASLEEARHRVFDFFRAACRSIPTVMDIYNLDDVVTKSHLRSAISAEIRKNLHVTNLSNKVQVIDMLLFKGMEELNNIREHAKQRHHIIGQYVVGNHGLVQDLGAKEKDMSDFLKSFYKSNYF